MRRMIPGQRLLRSPMLPKLWDFRDPFFDLTHSFQGLHERDLQEFGKLNAMDVIERKDDIQVELEVPGLKKENLDLVVKDDTITITGKVEEQDLKDDEKVWAKEVIHNHVHV
jgi:HSP20 family molecular chaperone IbpA